MRRRRKRGYPKILVVGAVTALAAYGGLVVAPASAGFPGGPPRPGPPAPAPGPPPPQPPTPQPPGNTTWQPGASYAIGATVTFLAVRYRCIQAHTAQVGWEPPNVPALWQRA